LAFRDFIENEMYLDCRRYNGHKKIVIGAGPRSLSASRCYKYLKLSKKSKFEKVLVALLLINIHYGCKAEVTSKCVAKVTSGSHSEITTVACRK